MCAARGDIFAVLSMPERYREEQAIAHANELRTLISRNASASHLGGAIPALTEEEANCLSFGALYFPWCFAETNRNNRSFLVVPPDGPTCGTMASRALARGAWIAPANAVWRGVVGVANRPLHDVEAEEMWADARVNMVKHEPVGVLVLSQDTLSWDPDLREINVRRLLMLLRRLAYRVGARYVFEPNNDAFRRAVQRNFQAVMESLYEKGAFRGKTPSESFRVNTGESINPAQGVEAGRFFIELKVAPSLPMKFLTVKLVQIGERGFVIEGK
jgi:phage tail sheath protein FI